MKNRNGALRRRTAKQTTKWRQERGLRRLGLPRPALWLLLLTAASLASGVHAQQPPQPLRVVATVGMIGDLAAVVAGECAAVTVMMGPGSDPHLYRASAGDVRALRDADLVLYGGLQLEGRLSEVLDAVSGRARAVAVSEGVIADDELIAGDFGKVVDPHVWLDASLWSRVPGFIARELAASTGFDPACSDAAAERAAELEAQLLALHAWAETAFTSVPEQQRVLVTAHDAFKYFGRAYGVEVVGVQGVSTESEAAVADVRRVIDAVVEREVPMLFVESTINPRTIQAVREGVRQRGGADVAIGPALYADALGAGDTPQGTYIGMFVHDVVEIVAGLGGTPGPLPAAVAAWQERWGYEPVSTLSVASEEGR